MTRVPDLPQDADAAVERITQRLGLPPRFLIDLLRENDWSFLIKVHALLEVAVRHLLATRFVRDGIGKFIGSLNHQQRLDFARQAGVIDPTFSNGLKYLAKLRNTVVHEIANVAFSFDSHLAKSNQALEFERALFTGDVSGTVQVAGMHVPYRELLRENPKLAIVRFAGDVIGCAYLETLREQYEHEQSTWARETIADLAKIMS